MLAANPHNSQPWKFRPYADGVDVLLDRSRALGPVDPFLRQMHIGIGCAIENLCVAARSRGLSSTVRLRPDSAYPDLAARITLASGGVVDNHHGQVIRRRHTNRGPYDRALRVPDLVRNALAAQATSRVAGLELFDAESERGVAFAQATLAASAALIADADFMAATDAWFRWTPRETSEHGDGPSLRCSGLAPALEILAVLGPKQSPDAFAASWHESTRDVQLPTAPTFGLITVGGATPEQFIEAGRLWQRVQLEATLHGLGMQPLDQAIEATERARQLGVAHIEPAALTPAGTQLAMMFRIGYPLREARASARRPLSAVLL